MDIGRVEKPVSESRDAYLAAQNALSENKITERHHAYARRYASEAAARAIIGGGAVDLDEVTRNCTLRHQGGNYPTYDVSSNSEVASVKTHWNTKGDLDRNSVAAYKREFLEMLGWNRKGDGLYSDGKNIVGAREAGAPVPKELEKASIAEAAVYLRDNSRFRVPDDHVSAVRHALEQEIRQFPGNFYLTDGPTDEQVHRVLERVQGIGVKSTDLQEMIAARFRV